MVSSRGLPGAQGQRLWEAGRGAHGVMQASGGPQVNMKGGACVWGPLWVLESLNVPSTLKKMKTCQSRVTKILGVECCMMTPFFPPFPCISATL